MKPDRARGRAKLTLSWIPNGQHMSEAQSTLQTVNQK
jgi:hypothetical protein